MGFTSNFEPLELEQLRREAAYMKAEQWRFVQMLAANNDEAGVDLYYSFMKDDELRNYYISAVGKETLVPSITDLFLAAFVFENEARELFGVNMGPIAIDFAGKMYDPAVDEPMTYISPEQKAAVDKIRKAAEAEFAKAKKSEAAKGRVSDVVEIKATSATIDAKSADATASSKTGSKSLRPDQIDKIKKALPTLPPERAAKLQAILDKEAVKSEEMNTAEKVEGFTPNSVVGAKPVVKEAHEVIVDRQAMIDAPTALRESDEQINKLLSIMDEERAAIVLEALKNERHDRG